MAFFLLLSICLPLFIPQLILTFVPLRLNNFAFNHVIIVRETFFRMSNIKFHTNNVFGFRVSYTCIIVHDCICVYMPGVIRAHNGASVCVWACILLVFWSRVSIVRSLTLCLRMWCVCMMCIQSVSTTDILLLLMSPNAIHEIIRFRNVTSPLIANLRNQLTF